MKKIELEQELAREQERAEEWRREADRLREELREAEESRDKWRERSIADALFAEGYRELSQAVGQLMDRARLGNSAKDALLKAMTANAQDTRDQAAAQILESKGRADEAERERDEARAQAQREKEIRARVHARFKRMRRDTLVAAKRMQEQSAELSRTKLLLDAEKADGRRIARFAMLAYATLEAEDKENCGKEPSWP